MAGLVENLNWEDVTALSDSALREAFKSLGKPIGPVTDSTRGFYKRRLKTLLEANKAAAGTNDCPSCSKTNETSDELITAANQKYTDVLLRNTRKNYGNSIPFWKTQPRHLTRSTEEDDANELECLLKNKYRSKPIHHADHAERVKLARQSTQRRAFCSAFVFGILIVAALVTAAVYLNVPIHGLRELNNYSFADLTSFLDNLVLNSWKQATAEA